MYHILQVMSRLLQETQDIKTHLLYKDLQTVYVDLLPIINTNDKLTISNLDNALINYILVIPFTRSFNKMNIFIYLFLSSTQNK